MGTPTITPKRDSWTPAPIYSDSARSFQRTREITPKFTPDLSQNENRANQQVDSKSPFVSSLKEREITPAEKFFTIGPSITHFRDSLSPNSPNTDLFQKTSGASTKTTSNLIELLNKAQQECDLENPSTPSLKRKRNSLSPKPR